MNALIQTKTGGSYINGINPLHYSFPSPSPADRTPILGPGIGTTYAWEGSIWQEPNVWFNAGYYHILYSAGSISAGGIGYAYATSPKGPWTKPLNHPVIGQTYGGTTTNQVVQHSGMYIEGDTIYFTASVYPFTGSLILWSAPLNFDHTTGPVFSNLGAIMTLPSGTNGWGNSQIVPLVVGSSYALLVEAKNTSTSVYKFGLSVATGALSSAPTFTVDTFPLADLGTGISTYYNKPSNLMWGGPWCRKVDDLYILYFHGGSYGTAQTDIFRATSTNLRTWTVDNRGYPILRRRAQEEVDQSGDPDLVQGPGGNYWMFEEGVANKASTFTIFAVPMYTAQTVMSNGNIEITSKVVDDFGELAFNEPLSAAATVTAMTLKNKDNVEFNLGINSVSVTLPRADWGAKIRIGAYNVVGNNKCTIVAAGGDTLACGNIVLPETYVELRADTQTRWVCNGYGLIGRNALTQADLYSPSPQWIKVGNGITHTALRAAALTNSITLFSLPAAGVIHAVKLKHSTAFAGTSFASYMVSVGIAGTAAKYAAAFDVFQAVSATAQQLSTTVGTENHTAATTIQITATSTGGNLSASTAGVVDVWALISKAL